MKYIKVSLGFKTYVRSDSLSVIKLWLDASFSTYNECRGHTGGMISLVAGSITSGPWKQRINERISTANNLIGVNYLMGPVLWKLYFIQDKGYIVERNIIFQDNHGTIHLMLNGNKSSLNSIKHINVRYFFVKDVINRG